ncbi:hypothetical protein KP509_13G078600 [Ceratopteris richardii]|uniref:Dolichyl-diphosphooligosaccharide--protein glycosyltransferase subunit DAD1 n=1 Tax=Ceratopteris richardii TaxID=49495 RepID=A0A8T2THA1_CERRI|nr:hypothetical protein KP509_13G078600 [Ceratopteris richardii]
MRGVARDVKALLSSIINLYVFYTLCTIVIKVVYMALVGSFPFNAFPLGFLSCVGTTVQAICLWMQVNPKNKEFKELSLEQAFVDFVLTNLVLHLVVMNFLRVERERE